jgi:hypothetical protein
MSSSRRQRKRRKKRRAQAVGQTVVHLEKVFRPGLKCHVWVRTSGDGELEGQLKWLAWILRGNGVEVVRGSGTRTISQPTC